MLELLDALQDATAQAVTETGDKIRFRFRNPNYPQIPLTDGRNATYSIDITAGPNLVQNLDNRLGSIADKFQKKLFFLTEELTRHGFRMAYHDNLSSGSYEKIKKVDEFFQPDPGGTTIKALGDPCDGTLPFVFGRLDWSVVVVIILDTPRLTVMFEPITDMLTVACLKDESETARSEAYLRNTRTGYQIDLVAAAQSRQSKRQRLEQASVGYHLPRTFHEERQAFYPKLDQIIQQCGSVFENCCGSVSLRQILTGELDAYIYAAPCPYTTRSLLFH